MSLRYAVLGLGLAVGLLSCGRSELDADACIREICACIFNAECPEDFVCINGRCIRREDVQDCLDRGPVPEVCNGRDDDCDGEIDQGLAPRPCTLDQDGVSCPGTATCLGEAGYVCDASAPGPELCDGLDNDCDGDVDEPLLTDAGYSTPQACGGCGNDCVQRIPGAVSTRCERVSEAFECRVTACEAGLQPSANGRACVAIGDGLCEICTVDADCTGVDSRCLDLADGERACGRACGPGTPLGDCPSGFRCDSGQCRPLGETCRCSEETLGSTRSCTVDVCLGIEICERARGGSFSWSECDISANLETCDGVDNDCDGLADEDFTDSMGRYVSAEHCSVCNNDCTRQFIPAVDKAIGGCDASSGTPQCVIQSCLTEFEGGLEFEWVDVNQDPSDGCECRRRLGNTGVDAPDVFPFFPDVGTNYFDENCDGVDGVEAQAIFVSAAAVPGGDGSRARPFQTIQDGLDALAVQRNRAYVLVAEGTYSEAVRAGPGARVYGGYSLDFTRRDVVQLSTVLQAPQGASAGPAQRSLEIAGAGVEVAGLWIIGPELRSAPSVRALASIGVRIESGVDVSLVNNVIEGGLAQDGARGPAGDPGRGRDDLSGLDGSDGLNHQIRAGVCTNQTRAGGWAGVNSVCGSPDVNGGDGGDATCPDFDFDATPVRGTQAQFSPPVGRQGAGGFHWSYDDISFASCSHVTESGFPSDIDGHNGEDGLDGPDGADGLDGAGCDAGSNGFDPLNQVFVSGRGRDGEGGVLGSGGGGGGAGGGVARFFPAGCADCCNNHMLGASGGGGGAGGCGGGGGRGGRGGGMSVAVQLLAVQSSNVRIETNRIRQGLGGAGGDGGLGGGGGRGGNGGIGGAGTAFAGSLGGTGGDGGNGGSGGLGGGGCGGASVGVFVVGGASGLRFDDNDYAGGPGLGGLGGRGAPNLGAGQDGLSQTQLQIESCGSDADCGPGASCLVGLCI